MEAPCETLLRATHVSLAEGRLGLFVESFQFRRGATRQLWGLQFSVTAELVFACQPLHVQFLGPAKLKGVAIAPRYEGNNGLASIGV